MKMFEVPQNVEKYLNVPLECSCGRTHFVPIKAVEVRKNALDSLPGYVMELGYSRPYILCDEITYKIAGAKAEQLLLDAGIVPTVHVLSHLGFDEATLGEIVVSIPKDADLMIGVGTGSITDMTRFSSFKLGLPCFTIATGAPMDGFAASIGILNVNNMKCTMPAHCTEVIIGDTDILKTAPYRMTVAGFGDLIGKLTCSDDWELARIINGEHYCRNISALVRCTVEDVLKKADEIKSKKPEALGDVMTGLILSGAAISLYGDSRPSSGSEHHMSHYWELVKEQRGERAAMHGEQVAVGTVLVLMLAEELKRCMPDFPAARKAALDYDRAEWENEIRRAYGSAAGEAIEMENKADKNGTEGRLIRIDSIEKHWDEILAQLSTLPSSDYLRDLLAQVGCPCTPQEIGIDRALLRDTFLYCKETRPRYTIFQLCYDLGILEELSGSVISRIF